MINESILLSYYYYYYLIGQLMRIYEKNVNLYNHRKQNQIKCFSGFVICHFANICESSRV